MTSSLTPILASAARLRRQIKYQEATRGRMCARLHSNILIGRWHPQ
jgi:hypothetical protein